MKRSVKASTDVKDDALKAKYNALIANADPYSIDALFSDYVDPETQMYIMFDACWDMFSAKKIRNMIDYAYEEGYAEKPWDEEDE